MVRCCRGPLLHVNVANKIERGMLGIAVAKHENGPTYVFLSVHRN